MRKIIERCPACGRPEMAITQLQCPDCGTEVRGAFSVSRFCRLSEASLAFLEMFVRNRGNLKEMERELGEAYTALRARLNDIIKEMGYEVREESRSEDVPPKGPAPTVSLSSELQRRRHDILEQLGAGELTAADAIERLRQLS